MRCSEQRDKITKEKDRRGKQKRNRCFWNELLELWGIDRIPSTRILKRLFMASLFMQNMQNMQKIREGTAAARKWRALPQPVASLAEMQPHGGQRPRPPRRNFRDFFSEFDISERRVRRNFRRDFCLKNSHDFRTQGSKLNPGGAPRPGALRGQVVRCRTGANPPLMREWRRVHATTQKSAQIHIRPAEVVIDIDAVPFSGHRAHLHEKAQPEKAPEAGGDQERGEHRCKLETLPGEESDVGVVQTDQEHVDVNKTKRHRWNALRWM